MKKVTYKLSNIFTLKKYKDNNLNCTSYNYPTIYGLRCAILGAIITTDGVEKAKELFNKVKNSNIYVKYPKEYKLNNIKQKRYSNDSYNVSYNKDDIKAKQFYYLDRDKLINSNWKTTMGFRQYFYMEEIVFYIDSLIPNIDIYLKNIDWIGTAETMVYLDSIEETNNLKDVLVQWDKCEYCETYEQHDWSSKTKFENVYMYSDQYKHVCNDYLMCIKDIDLS